MRTVTLPLSIPTTDAGNPPTNAAFNCPAGSGVPPPVPPPFPPPFPAPFPFPLPLPPDCDGGLIVTDPATVKYLATPDQCSDEAPVFDHTSALVTSFPSGPIATPVSVTPRE